MAVGYTVRGDALRKKRACGPRMRARPAGSIAPDGTRVALNAPAATPNASTQEHSVVFVLNVFDELRRRAPAGQ
jgi:hypothetical protein